MDMQALAKLVVAEIKGYVDDRFEAMIKSVAEQVKGIGEGVEMRTNEYAESVFVSKMPLMVEELNAAIGTKVHDAMESIDTYFNGVKGALEGHVKDQKVVIKSELESATDTLRNEAKDTLNEVLADINEKFNGVSNTINENVNTYNDLAKNLNDLKDSLVKAGKDADKILNESIAKHFEDVSAELKVHVEQSIAEATTQLTKEVGGMVSEQATLGAEYMKKQIGQHADALNSTFKLTVDEATKSAVEEALAALPKPIDDVKGKDGVDGRDAIHLEVLPSINPEKSYPRNTYAKHNGGLWRSFETTDGMRGWECVVEGIAAFGLVKDGERNVALKIVGSAGLTKELPIEFNGMLFKGQFSPSKMYNVGDTVMYAGSLWHCNVKGTDQVPSDGTDAWGLCAKRGRDGKTVVKAEIDPKQVKVKL